MGITDIMGTDTVTVITDGIMVMDMVTDIMDMGIMGTMDGITDMGITVMVITVMVMGIMDGIMVMDTDIMDIMDTMVGCYDEYKVKIISPNLYSFLILAIPNNKFHTSMSVIA